MKALLFFCFLAPLVVFGKPKVGFLLVYNCLSDGASFTPYLDEKNLSDGPMKPGQATAGIMNRVGKYKMHFRGDELELSSVNFVVEENKTVSVVVFSRYDEKKDLLVPQVVSLARAEEVTLPKGFLPLHLKSFSNKELLLGIGKEQAFLNPLETLMFKKWNGAGFRLKANGESVKTIECEDPEPHTLLLWDTPEGKTDALLIPHYDFKVPEDLRDDLSYGPRAEDIPGLIRPKE